ncbi:peptidoglycan editing factor PgeF [Planktotalea arctica]|uniref:peptidoglycan editing factor PgeF n=1 Tax=Planktotalea arctica TaxID=1481893 RepID=UPI000A16CBA4|nr:peptidoglycan editing factor PgeF [Planktotalea arctica]
MILERLKADNLGAVRHGFYTRKGGASSGIFQGLNCGVGSSDQRDIVAINRARVASDMGVAPTALVGVHQYHSADVVVIDAPSDARPKADAMVTNQPNIALGILTADCQPVLFADPKAGVIGAAHAGWKGALDGVLSRTVEAMEALGAARADISAAIGPCISQKAYEVGPEFFEDFIAQDHGYSQFFAGGNEDRMQFDLPGFGLHMLREAGVGHTAWIGHCTYSDDARFYSYRRTTHLNEADYGRLISVIRL